MTTAKQLASAVAKKLRVSKADALLVIAEITAQIHSELAQGHDVYLHGLGSLVVKAHGGGLSKNCKCLKKGEAEVKEWLLIPPHMRLNFTPAKALKAKVLLLPVPASFQIRKR